MFTDAKLGLRSTRMAVYNLAMNETQTRELRGKYETISTQALSKYNAAKMFFYNYFNFQGFDLHAHNIRD